jgi:hypothetical protein
MILQDGPLDGQEQLVLDLNTLPGYEMQFNLPNHQTFGPDGESVVGMGLVAVYSYQGPGPDPVPADGDTWAWSSIYEFTGEYFIPQPPPLYPPGGGPPVIPPPPVIFMGAQSGMTVDANDPSPGVQLAGEGAMSVDGLVTSFNYATVALLAETSMSISRQSWQNVVAMSAQTSLKADLQYQFTNMMTMEDSTFEGGTIGNWTGQGNGTNTNSTAQAHSGTHSLLSTATATNPVQAWFVNYIPVTLGTTYYGTAWMMASVNTTVTLCMYFYDINHSNVPSTTGPAISVGPGGWTQLTVTAQPPANAAYALLLWNTTAAVNAGTQFYTDDVVFHS